MSASVYFGVRPESSGRILLYNNHSDGIAAGSFGTLISILEPISVNN